MKKLYWVLLFYTFIFITLCFFTLNLNYVEGDDAATILYHLCGKNSAIQNSYAAYNSGFDSILSLSGLHEESSLRGFAVIISFVFGYVLLCLCAVFLDMVFHNSPKEKYWFMFLMPLIVPDFLFHSLIINPANVSFAFALLSVLLFMRFLKNPKWHYFIISILCLSLAIPIRWSIITIFPFFYSILLCYPKLSAVFRLKFAIIHNALAISFGLLFIYFSGYSPFDVVKIMLWGGNYLEGSEKSLLSMIAMSSAFFTPAFLLLCAFGIYVQVFRSGMSFIKHTSFGILPVIPFIILGFLPSFKFLITLLPLMLILAMAGYLFLAQYKFGKFVIAGLVLITWFIGVRVEASGTTAGPGFEQTFAGKAPDIPINEKNLDTRVKIKKVSPSLAGGFYMPMLEGPRPLYGYFYVLFAGGWKNNIQEFTDDRDKIITKLQHHDLIYVQDRTTAFLQCDLYRHNYQTFTPFLTDDKTKFLFRNFISSKDTIKVYVIPDGVPKIELADKFVRENNNVIFRSSYTSTILNLAQQQKNIRFIGPYTIIKE